MPVTNLTQSVADRLQPPPSRYVEYWDRGLTGFGVRVMSSGGKSWVAAVYPPSLAGKARVVTIGKLKSLPIAEAKKRARRAMQEAADGIDPSAVKAAAKAERAAKASASVYTIARMIEDYLPWSESEHKPKTYDRNVRMLGSLCRATNWSLLPATALTKQMVRAWGQELKRGQRGAIERYQQIGALRRVYDWAIEHDRLEENPVEGVKKAVKSVARERTLTDQELRTFWFASEQLGYPFGDCFKLLVLTGQRLGEVSGMSWRELDLNAAQPMWTIPKERAKNSRAHSVPLPPAAVAILRALPRWKTTDHVFSSNGRGAIGSFSRSKRAIEAAIGNDSWCLHDVRRTHATNLQRLDKPLVVIEACLNHVSGSRSGIVGVYNRHPYLKERIEAAHDYAAFIERLISQPEALTPLAAAA